MYIQRDQSTHKIHNKSPSVFQEMMSQGYAITAATDMSSNSSIFLHCNANMFRSASDTRRCMNDLGTAGPAVFVMFGINVTIVAKYMFDLRSDGQFFDELANGTFDVVLDTLVVAAERAERGITFSNVLVPANYLFVANADKHKSSAPNLSILTDQFTKQALTIWIFTAIALLLLYTFRYWLFGPDINDSLTLTLTIFALSLTVFYQAVIAQSLLIDNPVDIDSTILKNINRVASGNGYLYFTGENAATEQLLKGNDVISQAVQRAASGGRLKYHTNMTEILQNVQNNDDIFIELESYFMTEMKEYMNARNQCLNYRKLPLQQSISQWTSVLMTPIIDKTFVQQLNFQIAHRFEAVQVASTKVLNNMTDTCRRHFEVLTEPAVTFAPLSISVVSGAFWMLIALLSISFLALIVEICCGRKNEGNMMLQSIVLSSDEKDELTEDFQKIIESIGNREQLVVLKNVMRQLASGINPDLSDPI